MAPDPHSFSPMENRRAGRDSWRSNVTLLSFVPDSSERKTSFDSSNSSTSDESFGWSPTRPFVPLTHHSNHHHGVHEYPNYPRQLSKYPDYQNHQHTEFSDYYRAKQMNNPGYQAQEAPSSAETIQQKLKEQTASTGSSNHTDKEEFINGEPSSLKGPPRLEAAEQRCPLSTKGVPRSASADSGGPPFLKGLRKVASAEHLLRFSPDFATIQESDEVLV